MALDPIRNFAISRVATAPSPADSGTTLVLDAGDGALFPDPAVSGEFNVVIYPNGEQPDSTNAEIVRVTGRSTDTLTITREQEDTSARTVVEGDVVLLAITKKHIDDISDVVDSIEGFENSLVPAGGITMFAGGVAPTGYLLCDGSAVSRETYADLFAVISDTYGEGDGSTTFNLPDLKGKVVVGYDSTDTDFDALAEEGGVKEVTLTSAQSGLKAHNHTVQLAEGSGGSSYKVADVTANLSNAISNNFGATQNNTASDASEAHTNLQPYIVLNYIIKT